MSILEVKGLKKTYTTRFGGNQVLDKPTGGTVLLDGMNLADIRESAMAEFRRDNLGFVFQDFNLLDTFSLEDNIYLPLVLAGKNYREMRKRLEPIAKQLAVRSSVRRWPER